MIVGPRQGHRELMGFYIINKLISLTQSVCICVNRQQLLRVRKMGVEVWCLGHICFPSCPSCQAACYVRVAGGWLIEVWVTEWFTQRCLSCWNWFLLCTPTEVDQVNFTVCPSLELICPFFSLHSSVASYLVYCCPVLAFLLFMRSPLMCQLTSFTPFFPQIFSNYAIITSWTHLLWLFKINPNQQSLVLIILLTVMSTQRTPAVQFCLNSIRLWW